MIRYRARIVILAGVFFVLAVCGSPSQAQEAKIEEAAVEKVQPSTSGKAKAAITTEDPTIPVDELKLLVKPLTLEELQNESEGWLQLLKEKVKQISDAEIAVKRENRIINKEKEAVRALESAKIALKAAESAKNGANLGSPEYEEATKKVEEAKEKLKKAQSAIEEAVTTKKELQKDGALSEALDKAKETGELEKAKQTLDKAKKERENLTAGSLAYDEATKRIDTLDEAIKTFEEAQEAQKIARPDSPEYKKTTQELEAAEKLLKKALSAIEGTDKIEVQSSENFNKVANAVGETEISSSADTKVAGPTDTVDEKQNLNQKGKQLENAAKQLEKNVEADSKLKNQLVANVTEAQSERTAIVDRFKVVLDELELKGGDPKSYKQYIERKTRQSLISAKRIREG